jgi:hypothetical protein
MAGDRTVVTKLSVLAAIAVMSVGLAAQQGQMAPAFDDAQLERMRGDVRTFEIVLFRAIETAGQKLAQWADQQVPNTILQAATDPVVNGFATHDANLVFMVRMAELSGVAVFKNGLRFYPSQTGPGRVVSTPPVQTETKPTEAKPETRVAGTTVIPDDPMKTAPSPMDPDTVYSNLVRSNLIDAMLDSGGVLSMRESQMLTVVVVPIDVIVTNPLYRNSSRKLVLSIKGEDLIAFRAGKITREEVKQRIVDTRF